MMCVRVVLIDLPKDSRRVIDHLRLLAKRPAWATPYGLSKGELRSRKNANCRVGIFRRSEPSNEASPQTDESCIVPSHSGWRGSLHRRIPNDGQITAWLAQRVLAPPGGTALPGHHRLI